jgi:hypothetical protein
MEFSVFTYANKGRLKANNTRKIQCDITTVLTNLFSIAYFHVSFSLLRSQNSAFDIITPPHTVAYTTHTNVFTTQVQVPSLCKDSVI